MSRSVRALRLHQDHSAFAEVVRDRIALFQDPRHLLDPVSTIGKVVVVFE